MVRFVPLNLAAPFYPAEFGEHGDYDVILCRNVLMYFSAECQERIIRRFVAALAPGGWLLVGPCDISAELAVELRLLSTRPGILCKLDRTRAELQTEPRSPVLPEMVSAPPAPDQPQVEAPPPTPTSIPEATVPADVLARTHADRGELDEALAVCDAALATNKMDTALRHLRACVLLEMNRSGEAEAEFRRVLYLEPNSVMVHFALGSLAQQAGRADEARHHLQLVRQLLAGQNQGEPVLSAEGLTAGRLREVVEHTLHGNRTGWSS